MEHLKDYCLDVCVIDGLQTYVIDSAKYGVLIKDNELLNYLKKTDKDILSYIELTREIGIDKIYLAFAKFPTLIERLQWFPILCYKMEINFIMCIIEVHGCAESVSIE